jgi:HlyD family secretion protein
MGRITLAAVGAALVAALVWALWPQPLAVDLATVAAGRMEVRLGADGMTRVREPHTITAPIAGTTTRSPVEVGDPVERGGTVVAIIRPVDPGLMDARTRAQAEAAVAEGEAALRLAEARLEQAHAALDYARTQAERGEGLARAGTIPQRMLDELRQALTSAQNAAGAAEAERALARASLARAQAQLVGPGAQIEPDGEGGACCVQILATLTGTVLDVMDRNARQVAPGTPLLTIGDLADLEIETDLLSADAVRIAPGTRAVVDRWGGAGSLEARVRRVEPAAFTRVSALGIEEQRVRVMLDLLAPPDARPGLGDRFRVLVSLVVWEGDAALQVPQGALFRHAGGWAVFRVVDGRAQLVPVGVGQRSAETAEITAGLAPGDAVVLFPPNTLADGMRVVPR